jgi:DNA-binding response OmpR family regulator
VVTEATASALVIAHEAEVRQILRDLLKNAGIAFLEATDGASGVKTFYQKHPSLVVLDFDLPAREGREVLSIIRELSTAPVLVLSSLDSEMEKVQALRSGADDFLCKPFGRQEILAMVEAMLRRSPVANESPSILADDFVEIDQLQHKVQALGVDIELTPTEFRMLCAFVGHPDRVLTHTQLLEIVWDHGYRDRDEVKLYVSYLRRKLREAVSLDPIETVRGVGYRYRPRRLGGDEGAKPPSD